MKRIVERICGRSRNKVFKKARACKNILVLTMIPVALGFVVSGFLAGLTGVLLVARLGLAEPTIGDRFLFDSFTVVFLGAASIKIGQFHILGTLIGALIMGTIFNGFTLLDVPYHLQLIVEGAILIAAVTAAGLWKERFKLKRRRVR